MKIGDCWILLNLRPAQAGDAEAGRALMGEFAHMLRNGMPPDAAAVLADMLERIERGEDAHDALLLRQRGAPHKGARDHWIWQRVTELQEQCPSLAETYRKVADELKQWPDDAVSAKRVKAVYLEWERWRDPERYAERQAEIEALAAQGKEAQ